MLRTAFAAWLLFAAAPAGQDPTVPAGQGQAPPTAAELQARLDAVKANDALPAELKTALQDVLGPTIETRRQAQAFADAAATFRNDRDGAPAELQTKRRELAALGGPTLPEPQTGASTHDLEQQLAQALLDQQNRLKEVADLEKEASRRAERRALIPARLVEAQKALDDLPAVAAEPGVDPRLLAVRRLRQEVERWRLEQEIAALELELAAYEERSDLLTVRRDLAARRSNNARAVAEAWQKVLQDHRARAADDAAQAAAVAARQADHPLLRQLADGNATIAAELAPLAARRQELEQDNQRATTMAQELQARFQDLRDRVQRAGTTPAIGALLRERRASLPDVAREFRRHTRDYDALAANAFLQARDWEQQRRELADDPGLVDRLLRAAEPAPADATARANLRRAAADLLATRLEHLQTLKDGWSSYLGNLEQLAATQQAIAALVTEFRAFVNERVLWIRSSPPVWRLDVAAVLDGVRWAAAPANWATVLETAWAQTTGEAWPLLALTLIGLLLLGRPLLHRRLQRHGERAARGNNIRYRPTALALVDTILLAAPLPALLWLLGQVLLQSPECSDFGLSLAIGAQRSAGFLAVVLGLREIVRRDGLAERHFRWQPATLALLRSNLALLLPAALPLALALGALEQHGDDAVLGSLGRLLLLPLLGLLTVFLWRLLHPVRGVLGSSGDRTVLHRFRRLWFGLGCGTPAVLMALAVLGYDYTALQLARTLLHTVTLVLAGVLVHELILRQLLLERRRLTIEQARERLQAARAAGDTGAEDDEPEPDEVQLDPSSVARQTHTLVRGAIALVVAFLALQFWIDVLPALGVFRGVTLWTDHSAEPPVAITLADLLVSVLILAVTLVAARNVPGMLELLLLQRLRIKAGERHAITTLARYLVIVVGIVVAFASIGLGWTKVQWLIAAVSLGLGFGLQEIFANFVSGLILLFERPVRVGDWVAVGDVLGKVTRIQIRATTVRDLDNKELVVPNKEFVTSRFVNWTLTDSFVRLRVRVGVAYGSDTELARRLLVQAARESPFAAQSQPPRALFLGFGDSALDLELRVFVEEYDRHADMLDDLHGRIDKLFRAHRIEIAFPQRDLHLRSAGPLAEFLERRAAEREGIGDPP